MGYYRNWSILSKALASKDKRHLSLSLSLSLSLLTSTMTTFKRRRRCFNWNWNPISVTNRRTANEVTNFTHISFPNSTPPNPYLSVYRYLCVHYKPLSVCISFFLFWFVKWHLLAPSLRKNCKATWYTSDHLFMLPFWLELIEGS